MDSKRKWIDRYPWKLNKLQKAWVCLNTIEVKTESKVNAAYENDGRGGLRVTDYPADVFGSFKNLKLSMFFLVISFVYMQIRDRF